MSSTDSKKLFTAVLVSLLLIFVASGNALAQGTNKDYLRMDRLSELTSNTVFRSSVVPNWLPGNDHFWYRVKTDVDSFEFVLVDIEKGIRNPAFDYDKVIKQLRLSSADDQLRLPNQVYFSADLKSCYFQVQNQTWKIERTDSTCTKVDNPEFELATQQQANRLRPSSDLGGETQIDFSNDSGTTIRLIWIDRSGRRVPYGEIKSGESFSQHTFVGHVWLVVDLSSRPLKIVEANAGANRVAVKSAKPIQLVVPESKAERSNRSEFDRRSPDGKWQTLLRDFQLFLRDTQSGEESQLTKQGSEEDSYSPRVCWSADSKVFVANQTLRGDSQTVHLIESSPKDQLQPRLHSFSYTKPGDSIDQRFPHLFDVENKKEIHLDKSLFANPWSINGVQWNEQFSEFRFLYNQRGHQVMRYLGLSSDGIVRTIIEEKTDSFVDYTNKFFLKEVDDGRHIIWMSERDGWNHLYMFDAKMGELLTPITSGEWVVRGVDLVDEKNRQIWFRASGLVPGQDPYFVHYCRVNFDGSQLVVLTEGDGNHSIEFSPDKNYVIDTFSRVDLPPQTNLRRVSDGSLVCQLESADWSLLLETGWKKPIPFSAKGRDGRTDIYGVIYLPTNFDQSNSYPVIEHIYAGPHGSFVPKSFSTHHQMRAMAELGFILVQIDGMGTSNRSKAFHDICWKNLGDSGFPDRILWMKAAAKSIPQMDLERVGIYGGSAGGQSTLGGLLAYPDFYKVGVSDCGCHDNRMDKIWWNEQWMGWPIGPHYEEQSNVTNAHRLQGKLLLIVGELDRNVDPASTMQVVNALINADKDFDLLVVPGAGHGVGSGRYGMRRTRDFFVRHLHRVEPRK